MWRATCRAALALLLVSGLLGWPAGGGVARAETPWGPFADDNGSIHERDIISLEAAGITGGCDFEGHRFCPTDPVSRGQMAAFLRRALDLPATEADHFTDDEASMFEEAIDALAEAGYTEGCGGDRYCPKAAVSRAEMAAFLRRALDLPGTDADHFTDDQGSPFEGAINALAEAGHTEGCGGDRYCPDHPVSREQMASLLVRALDIPAAQPQPCSPEVCGPESLVPENPRGAEDWRPLVGYFFAPGDVDRAVAVIGCESGGNPNAYNAAIGAAGLFQHLERYWPERAEWAGFAGRSVFDPVANVGVAAWLLSESGWGNWPSCP